jgi:hypothetical protein
MTTGTYEDELQPIQGAKFLDRVLGWFCIACGVPILGVAINRYLHPKPALSEAMPGWVEPARVLLVVLGLVGILAITTSKPKAFKVAMALYGFRILGLLALYPWSGGPRFSGSEFLFDVVVIGYCWLRLRQPESVV